MGKKVVKALTCPTCGVAHATHRPDGKPQCQKHRTKARPYVQCHAIAMKNGCCYHHGGASVPAGPNHHAFKTGVSSAMFVDRLAGRLLDDYLATPDANLSSFDEDIRLFEARRGQLLDRINAGESSGAWQRAKESLAAVRKAKDADTLDVALTTLGEVIDTGAAADECWRELEKTTDHLRRLRKERVRKAQVETAYVPLEEMVLWARFSTKLAVECIREAADAGAQEMLQKFLAGVNEFANTREIKQLVTGDDGV